MDPNAALDWLRSQQGEMDELSTERTRLDENPNRTKEDVKRIEEIDSDMSNLAHEIASNFRDLDEWLSKGGFLPSAWQR